MSKISLEDLALIKLAIQAALRMLGLARAAENVMGMDEDQLTAYLATAEDRKAAVDERLKAQ